MSERKRKVMNIEQEENEGDEEMRHKMQNKRERDKKSK